MFAQNIQTMKKVFLFCALAGIVFASYSPQQAGKDSAVVDRIEGLYVFVDSKPVMDTEYLGTVKAGSGMGKAFSMSSQEYEDRRNKMIKKVKEEYPAAEGVILHFKSGGKDAADAIKFK